MFRKSSAKFAKIQDVMRENGNGDLTKLLCEKYAVTKIMKKEKVTFAQALTGFSCEIFHMKKKPSASMTVRTESA
jgi:hypothetical protein